MKLEERINIGVSLKSTGRANCAQAVLASFQDLVDVDLNTLLSLGSGFAVGMGTMEANCGSLLGANMILGLIVKNGTVRYSRILLNKFKGYAKDITCNILKGLKTGVVLTECNDCVKYAIISLYEVLTENNIVAA